jgi:twitching motility protein PilJ
MAGFRLPFIGRKPILAQLQVLGTRRARRCFAFVALLVFVDVNARCAERDLHHHHLADAVPSRSASPRRRASRARGQAAAFAQVQDSRDEFATYLEILQRGGFTSARRSLRPAPRGDQEPPRGARPALARERAGGHRDPRGATRSRALAQNIAQIAWARRRWRRSSQELTGLMSQSGSAPGQVLRANRLTFLAERLGRGSAEILGAEIIDPEVPFLIGKDTNDLRDLLRALESGSDASGRAASATPRRAPSSRS